MKPLTKLKLAAVHQLCDAEDRSTEYTLQLMQDTCNVSLNTCVSYMNLGGEEHGKLWEELNDFVQLMIKLGK